MSVTPVELWKKELIRCVAVVLSPWYLAWTRKGADTSGWTNGTGALNWSGALPSVQNMYSTFSAGDPAPVFGRAIMLMFCSRWIVSRKDVGVAGAGSEITPEIESGTAAGAAVQETQYTFAYAYRFSIESAPTRSRRFRA